MEALAIVDQKAFFFFWWFLVGLAWSSWARVTWLFACVCRGIRRFAYDAQG